MGQLRDAVRGLLNHWEVLVLGNDLNAKRKCIQQIGSEMIILDSVEVVQVRHRQKRMVINMSFPQPDIVSRMTQYQRVNWWTNSNYLETGNLVALVDARLRTTFLLVSDRVVLKDETQGRGYGSPSWDVDDQGIQDLAGDANRALISFTLAKADSVQDKELIMEISRQTVGTSVLVQFPDILYAAFAHFLRRLKSLHNHPVLPFIKWIAPDAGTYYTTRNGLLEVPPPPYLRAVDLDLSCITTNRHQLSFSVQRPVTVEQLERYTTLDRGQCQGFIMSLMHELALIQGPPGTGKSFVGEKLVQVLLANRHRLNIGPIICIWYVFQSLL